MGELQKQVYDVSRNKQYLEIANTSLLQEARKTKDVLNEKIKKLRQRLKKIIYPLQRLKRKYFTQWFEISITITAGIISRHNIKIYVESRYKK